MAYRPSTRDESFITGLTANQVTFGDTDGSLAQDPQLVWDNTQKFLGVGGTPLRKLDVLGSYSNPTGQAIAFGVRTTLTSQLNDSCHGAEFQPRLVEGASGTHPIFSSLLVRKPLVTAGGAAVGTVASLYVVEQPTEGSNNYALFVEKPGVARFGANVTVAGTTLTKELNVTGATSTSITAPTGVLLTKDLNTIGETVGITFGFNGGSVSAAITAVQLDTTNQGADLAFSTRTTAGVTAEHLRLTGAGNLGLGTTAPSIIGTAVSTFTVLDDQATGFGVIEVASQRTDGDAASIGQVRGVYDTNSATHKLIASIAFESDGTTANQRGGAMVFKTKADAATTFTERFRIGRLGVGFFAAAAAAQQVSGADLTNNVTVGGTDNTIGNIVAATTDVTAASLTSTRDAIYQIARKLKQLNDGVRVYGLFT